jgi:hypothetical protein
VAERHVVSADHVIDVDRKEGKHLYTTVFLGTTHEHDVVVSSVRGFGLIHYDGLDSGKLTDGSVNASAWLVSV